MNAAHRSDGWTHCETLTSPRTETLFVALALLSLLLARWRRMAGRGILGKFLPGSSSFFSFTR
jgi:hypothetical protein